MIQTERLLLRPWQPEDWLAVLELLEADRLRLAIDFPKTLAMVLDEATAKSFVKEKMGEWAVRAGYQFGIWEIATGQCIGFFSFKNLDWTVPRAELAYVLAARAEGQGFMQEAGSAAINWSFQNLGLERLYCHARPDNFRSAALAKRLGFRPEGLLRHAFRGGDGQLYNTTIYGLLRSEYRAAPAQSA